MKFFKFDGSSKCNAHPVNIVKEIIIQSIAKRTARIEGIFRYKSEKYEAFYEAWQHAILINQ